MEQVKVRARRRHDSELKRIVLAQCAEPGASVASVALRRGLNANLVHQWRRLARRGTSGAAADLPAIQFVPVALPQSCRWPHAKTSASNCAAARRRLP